MSVKAGITASIEQAKEEDLVNPIRRTIPIARYTQSLRTYEKHNTENLSGEDF